MIYTVTPESLPGLLASDIPVVIDFYADWCGPCKMLAPIIENIANKLEGQVKFAKVDCDAQQGIAVQFGITSMPTLILFKNGVVSEKLIGLKSAPEVEQFVLS